MGIPFPVNKVYLIGAVPCAEGFAGKRHPLHIQERAPIGTDVFFDSLFIKPAVKQPYHYDHEGANNKYIGHVNILLHVYYQKGRKNKPDSIKNEGEIMKKVRNSIKAVIIRDGQILLTANKEGERVYYLLPGGGQEPGETMEAALIRECREEIGAGVEVGAFLWVREFIADHYDWAVFHGLHQVEFMFACTLEAGAKPHVGNVKDTWQTGVEWVPLDKLSNVNLYPAVLKELIPLYAETGRVEKVYLGDVG
jgi:8-oxo-dGTP diphosphatase